MNPEATAPRPTDAELAILRILWERGPSTVRQVHDILANERPAAYTTALKLLQIMTEKGLVERDERDRTHIYRARAERRDRRSANSCAICSIGRSADRRASSSCRRSPRSARRPRN